MVRFASVVTEVASLPPPPREPDDFEPGPPSPRDRLLSLIAAPARLAFALVVPDRAVPSLVDRGRYGTALLFVWVASLLAALAIGTRLDVSQKVLGGPPVGGGPGGSEAPRGGAPSAHDREPGMSDREIEENLEKTLAAEQVKLGLRAGLGAPAMILLYALGLYAVGRYVGGKPTFERAMAASTVAALPGGVADLLRAGAALLRERVRPDEIDSLLSPGDLVPQGGAVAAAKLFAGLDLFTLWSLVLCGFAFSAAAGVSRRKGFVTVSVGYLLVLLLRNSLGAS